MFEKMKRDEESPTETKNNFSPLPIYPVNQNPFHEKRQENKGIMMHLRVHTIRLFPGAQPLRLYTVHTLNHPIRRNPLLLRNLGFHGTVAGGKVYPEGATEENPSGKLLLCRNSRLDIGEVSVGKASWLTGSPVHSNPDIEAVLNVLEKFVDVIISHLVVHVANEQGLGWWVRSHPIVARPGKVLDVEAPSIEDGVVHLFTGLGCSLQIGKLNISETLRQSLHIMDDFNTLDLTGGGKVVLKILLGGIKLQVTDVQSVGGL